MLAFFHKIVDVLNGAQIPYMLSGSMAMGVYVVPRATRDFDFVISLKSDDVDKFATYFQEGYYCNPDAINHAVKHQSIFNIIDHNSGYKADFIVLKNDAFRQEEFSRRVAMNYFGKTIYLVSVEDLLLSKLIWIQPYQSAMQMEDIKNLGKAKALDWPYIDRWVKKLNLETYGLTER